MTKGKKFLVWFLVAALALPVLFVFFEYLNTLLPANF